MKKELRFSKREPCNPCQIIKTIKNIMSKKETLKFIVQMIASIATAIVTALGATSCMGM